MAARKNMVQNKAAMKRYDNKESGHNNHKIDFVHDVFNPKVYLFKHKDEAFDKFIIYKDEVEN